MTASVTIVTAQRAGVVLVPASAITFARSALTSGIITRAQLTSAVQQAAQQLASMQSSNPNLADDKPATSYVLERSNGKWTVVPVIIGLTSGSVYEVLWGLNGGETVVTGQVGGATTTTGATSTGTGTGRGTGGGFGGGGFGGAALVAAALVAAALAVDPSRMPSEISTQTRPRRAQRGNQRHRATLHELRRRPRRPG